ncbi:FAD-dependent pyridine nucleotide-disulfide oxidoreductase [Corynebacterium glyciniphilum AJ 3170]|uniref:FAD-dependent pyridine nucleotide-disulfide oxidoreductase n=1 Tax=Corynebacterium glyciniphilum AJ 3170 TaxID=1404245 RepID=X5DWZ6_9CORY|nr:NAD(P)/FAD-dependent oxidoreductase [Corynebacterium glyciniphilum]AHW65162.1 FAD-dependent pyridine nucleotide-disulfide oxidoreductase [Corynebacterium glyciniphilum AJ 3170]
MTTTDVDVVIVGGGAAGLSAALMLSRARRRVTVLDAGKPRNLPSEHLHGYLGHDGTSPESLLNTGRKEAASYGASIRTGTVRDIRASPDLFGQIVSWDGGTVRCRAVVVATGLNDQLPDVPGLAEGWGRWAFHCPYCHGYEIQQAPVAVIGGDNHAFSLKQAGLLAQLSDEVVFYLNGMQLTTHEEQHLVELGVEIIDARVHQVSRDAEGCVTLCLDGSREACFDTVFVGPRFSPNNHLLRAAGCDLNGDGRIDVDDSGRTSKPGLWAAGNVVSSPAQLINSAAAGAAAAISVNDALVFESPRQN